MRLRLTLGSSLKSAVTESVPVLALDGPGGSGKGTVARRLAELLGWQFLDSGALYRLVGLAALEYRNVTISAHLISTISHCILSDEKTKRNASASPRKPSSSQFDSAVPRHIQ